MELTWWEIILRMLCAMVIGAVVGIEREYSKHPAGMRTHTLVALGACTVMITGELIFLQYRALGATPDPARLAAQVIAGVGFLGAGTILRDGTTIRGLTTAAGIWVVACLGVAVGAGYYLLTLAGTSAAVFTLISFEWLQKKLLRRKNPMWHVTISTDDISKATEGIQFCEMTYQLRADSMQIDNLGENQYKIAFRVEFCGKHWETNASKFWKHLDDAGEITVLRIREWNGR